MTAFYPGFASRPAIATCTFRNIRGGFLNFQEPGDVDMLKAMHVYKEIGTTG